MSRLGRMLLVLAFFAIASIVMLGMMAWRYNKILERRGPSAPSVESVRIDPAPGSAAAEPLLSPAPADSEQTPSPREDADRYVAAYIQVRRALTAPAPQDADGEAEPGESGARLGRALEQAGITREEYVKIDKLFRAWKDGGTRLSGPIPDAFVRRRDDLKGL